MSAETPFDSKDYGRLLADLLDAAKKGAVAVDDHEGSIARTLLEAFARELAVCYEQLRRVYQFGYLDSAEGSALDKVVALLGIDRLQAGHVEGTVIFSRGQPAPEDIPIPPGTLLTGRGVQVFETVEKDVAIPKGEMEVAVKVRSVEPGGKRVEAGQISLMPRPVRDIDKVTNTAPLELRQRGETDNELRERARYRLERVNLGTVGAIEQAVRELGIAEVTVRENLDVAGDVAVILGDADISDDLRHQAEIALARVRPAGVRVTVLVAGRIYVQVAATLILREEYADDQKKRIRSDVETNLKAYFDSLKIGELVRLSKIEAILTAPGEVVESRPLQGKPKLNTYLLKNGQLADATNTTNYLRNGDLQPGGKDRAALDLDKLPVLLKLEPPSLDVWVDVAFDRALTAEEEAKARQSLQVVLDTFKSGSHIGYQDLNRENPPIIDERKVTSFTLIHQSDKLAVTLAPDNKLDDLLRERERLVVGKITSEEQNRG